MRDIKPINNNGSIQLKFSFGGKRHSFNPIPGDDYNNRRDMATAKAIAVKIQNDILAGCFDTTLHRYRLELKVTPAKAKPKTMLELWDAWVETLDLTQATRANHYEWVRRMLVKTKPELMDTVWLTQSKLAPATFKDRLSLLKSCGRWAVTEGLLETNPYEGLKPRKAVINEVKPFSSKELQAIIAGFEASVPHYAPFVRFLFFSGVRISEAIGLRWSHIDFDRNELTIRESLSKDVTGNGYTRVRKDTKTGSIRHLTLNHELRTLLLAIRPRNVDADALVFTTVEGCTIDADNFRDRQWKKVLTMQQVPYRKPHAIRHTLLSHAVEQGIPLTGVAYLAGHCNTRTVVQTYGHMINRPSLPVFNLGDH
jgi:integrase